MAKGAKNIRAKGFDAERQVKKLFEKNGFEAIRTGSGICPDMKGDVNVKLEKYTLVGEVKSYKSSFKEQYNYLKEFNHVLLKKENISTNIIVFEFSYLIDLLTNKIIPEHVMPAIPMIGKVMEVNDNNFDVKQLDKLGREATDICTIPILIKRANNKEWLISMYVNDFNVLLNDYNNGSAMWISNDKYHCMYSE